MSIITKQTISTKYANIDMDKFKFDFNLFVPDAASTITEKNNEQKDTNK